LQRSEEAAFNWKKCGDLSVYPLEYKIKIIGGENLDATAQFDNLHKLFEEVNILHMWW
jgi:hypothetical protein